MARRCVTIYNAYDLLSRPEFYRRASTGVSDTVTGVAPDDGLRKQYWVPARPLGPSSHQWRAVWLVWTGRADVLHWPGQER